MTVVSNDVNGSPVRTIARALHPSRDPASHTAQTTANAERACLARDAIVRGCRKALSLHELPRVDAGAIKAQPMGSSTRYWR